MGDSKQTIYSFMVQVRSDNRFLIHSKHIFSSNNPWVDITLYETFRIPQPISNFINKALLGTNDNILISNKYEEGFHVKPQLYLQNYIVSPADKSVKHHHLTDILNNCLTSGYLPM